MGLYNGWEGKDHFQGLITYSPLGAVALVLLAGALGYNISKDAGGGANDLPPATTAAGALATGSALEAFPGGLMCSPEKSTVVVDQRSMVDGNYSLYRAINVSFGEETDIGIPGGNPIQGTPTEAFVLKVAEESGITVTDVNNVPPETYQVRSICNGPGTSWNANSTTV